MANLIMDIGSGSIKTGLCSALRPSEFPAIVGFPLYPNASWNLQEQRFSVGNEARRKKGVLRIEYPITHGIIKDWDGILRIWDYTLDTLSIVSQEHRFLVTEASKNPISNRETMTQIFFETYHVPAMYVAVQAELVLKAAGRTTGLVVDLSDGVTHQVPVCEGLVMTHEIERLDFAGRDLT